MLHYYHIILLALQFLFSISYTDLNLLFLAFHISIFLCPTFSLISLLLIFIPLTPTNFLSSNQFVIHLFFFFSILISSITLSNILLLSSLKICCRYFNCPFIILPFILLIPISPLNAASCAKLGAPSILLHTLFSSGGRVSKFCWSVIRHSPAAGPPVRHYFRPPPSVSRQSITPSSLF